jgi:AmmeMemoRadiSam system protein B
MNQTHIRPAAVAGMFYPGDPQVLSNHINELLEMGPFAGEKPPKVLIVPHAGTIYSGGIAASAYAHLKAHASQIKRVVLLGPTHRVALRGLGLPSDHEFETPLGSIPLDTDCISTLVQKFSQVSFSDRAHAEEHSLEVQLPFLQTLLSAFKLIPFAVGDAAENDVAQVIDHLWGDNHTLIIVSTDLSHFHGYDTAKMLDEDTAQLIETFNGAELREHSACGRIPLRGLLSVARTKALRIERYDLRNSGDTAGPRDQVVGYGSWGLYED